MMKAAIFLLFLLNLYGTCAKEAMKAKNTTNGTSGFDFYNDFGKEEMDIDLIVKLASAVEIEAMQDDDVIDVILRWPDVPRRFLVHYSDVSNFYNSQVEQDRETLEKATWLPWKLEKYQRFFYALNSIQKSPFNYEDMEYAMRILSDTPGQMEVLRVYDAVQCFEGLRYSQLPKAEKDLKEEEQIDSGYIEYNHETYVSTVT